MKHQFEKINIKPDVENKSLRIIMEDG